MGKEDKDQRFDQGYQSPSSLYQAPVMAQDNTRTVASANAQLQSQLHGQPPRKKPEPQLSNTQKVALIVGELALIMARLHCDLNPLNPLNLFDLHKGDFWGEIDVGELLLVLKLVAPPDKFAEATKNVVLDGKTYGTNRVFVRGNIFEAWINVASPELHVGGIKTDAFTSGAANLKGFSASFDYPKGTASLSILEATLGTAQLIKGTDKISVDALTIKGLHLDGGKTGSVLHGSMSFVSADMERLRYPGMPPISMSLAGGTSFAGVWQQQPKQELPAGQTSPTTAPAATAPGGPPASKPLGVDQMLPADAEIKVSITHARAAAASFNWLAPVAGASAGIDHAKIALVRASGLELASFAIHDFTVAGGMIGGGAGASGGAVGAIGKLELRGDAALVQTLLSAPVVHPELASAVAAVRRLGIQPAIGGSVTLEDLHFGGLKQGQGAAARITGDFATHVEVPKLGSLDVTLRDFDVAGGAAGGMSSASTSFASFTAVLRGDGGGELARLELEGGGVKVGKQTAGTLKTLKATGDVSGLLKALKEPMKTAPASVRGALAAVRALGVGVGVSASGLSVTESSKGAISYAGDLHASLKTNLGRIELGAIGVRGTDASIGAMAKFSVALYTAGGAKAASIVATGLKANVASKKQNAGLHADHLEVHGDYAQVSAMIAAVRAKAPGLAPPVRQALGAVEDLHLQGQLAISVDDVSATESKQGRVSARIGALDNAFDVPGVGKVGLKLRGIEGAMGGGVGGSGGVDHFELRLLTPAGGQALRIAFDGGNSEATARAEDYAINLKHLELTGDATRLATMVAGARAHYQQMGGPALHTLEVVEQYLHAFPAQLGITVDNARMASIDGKQTGVGDITTSVALPTGKVAMKLGGASIDAGGGEGGSYRFREFHLFITDAQGKVAASVQLLRGGVQDYAGSPGITGGAEELQVTGDMDRIRTLFSPEMRPYLPADMLAVFDQLAGSKLDLAIQDATVRSGFGDGTQIGVGALRLVSELRFRDEQGNQYEVRGAHIAIEGAQTKLGPDGQVHEISASGLTIQGLLVASGEHRGSAGVALKTGPAIVHLKDGTPVSAEVSRLSLSASAQYRDPVPASSSQGQASTTGTTTTTTTTGTGTTTTGTGTGTTTTPTKAPPLPPVKADLPSPAEIAAAAGALIQDINIHTRTPVTAGRWGKGIAHIDVPGDAAIHINLVAKAHQLDPRQTNVQIIPPFQAALGVKLEGAHLAKRGTEAAIKFDLGGLVGKVAGGLANLFNAASAIPMGGKHLPLDLSELIAQVMSTMKSEASQEAARQAPAPTPTPTAPPPSDATGAREPTWLEQAHAEWEADRSKTASIRSDRKRAKQEAEDIRTEPRSAEITDLFTQGVQLMKTSGTVAIGLDGASEYAQGDLSLQGEVSGTGTAELMLHAGELHVDTPTQQAHVTGLDGIMAATRKGDLSVLSIEGLTLEHAMWRTK